MINKGTYINFNGEKTDFSYTSELTLSQRAGLVMEAAGMIVSGEVGYAYVLRDAIFNYCLIKYFTDIQMFENEGDFSLDMIDKFVKDNQETVIKVITDAMGETAYNELVTACDEAIEFRKSHFSDYKEEVSDLLQVVREYVVKPDYLNELLIAATNALNSFADKGDIDMSVVNQLIDTVSILKDVGGKEVAKAIIETKAAQSDGTSKPKPKAKSNSGRKPKTKKPDDGKIIDMAEYLKTEQSDKGNDK